MDWSLSRIVTFYLGFSLFLSPSCSSNSFPGGIWGQNDLCLSVSLRTCSALVLSLSPSLRGKAEGHHVAQPHSTHCMWESQPCHVARSETVWKREEEEEGEVMAWLPLNLEGR